MLKKQRKKIIGLILSMMLAMTAFAGVVPAGAQGEVIAAPSDVGLYIDTTHASYAAISKHVVIQENDVLVMSHISDSRYYIGSVAGKNWKNSSSNGSGCITDIIKSDSYTLSYVNSGFEAESVNIIKGGYIKAENDTGVYYVPITSQKNVTVLSINQKNKGAATSDIISAGQIGGKAADDMADVMTIGESPIGTDTGVLRADYHLTKVGIAEETTAPYNASKQPFTLETNILLTGNSAVVISLSATDYIKIDSDGYFWYDSGTSTGASAGFAKSSTQISRDRWHKIALTWDILRSRLLLFCDGKLVTNSASYVGAGMSKLYGNPLGLRIRMDTGSVNSTAALDDLYGYIGYYYNDDALEAPVESENVKVDTANKTVSFNKEAFADVSALNEAVKTVFSANYAALFKSDLSAPSEEFAETDIMVITSADGDFYDYYSVVPKTAKEWTAVFDADFETENHGIGTQMYSGMFTGAVEANASYGLKTSGVYTITDGTLFTDNEKFQNPLAQLNYQGNYIESKYITAEADVYSENDDVQLNFSVYYKYGESGSITSYDIYFIKTSALGNVIRIAGDYTVPYKTNQWYKVAITFDTEADTISTYINGDLIKTEKITVNEQIRDIVSAGGRFRIGSVYNTIETEDATGWTIDDKQKNSLKAVDNMKMYLAPYDNSADVLNVSSTDETKAVVMPEYLYADPSALPLTAGEVKALIGSDALVYTNNEYSALLSDSDELTTDSVIVKKSENVIKYFAVAEDEISLVTTADGTIYASAPYVYDKASEHALYLAEYDGDLLTNVTVKKVGGANEGSSTDELAFDSSKTYKAFFWNEELKPIRVCLIYEGSSHAENSCCR